MAYHITYTDSSNLIQITNVQRNRLIFQHISSTRTSRFHLCQKKASITRNSILRCQILISGLCRMAKYSISISVTLFLFQKFVNEVQFSVNLPTKSDCHFKCTENVRKLPIYVTNILKLMVFFSLIESFKLLYTFQDNSE